MNSRILKLSVLFVISIFLVFGFGFLFIFSARTILNERVEFNLDELESNEYRFDTYNSLTKETTTGFASTFQELGENEFISYENMGIHSLISNFESKHYVCTGSCFCEPTVERRSTNTLIRKGVIYLVAAATSFFAYDLAKEQFQNECENLVSSSSTTTCETTSLVRSYVDGCYLFSEDDDNGYEEGYEESYPDDKDLKGDEDEDEDEDWDDDDFKAVGSENSIFSKNPTLTTYTCKGHCLKRNFKIPSKKKMVDEFGGCSKLKTSGVINVRNDGIMNPNHLEVAKLSFEFDVLVPFCELESRDEKNNIEIGCCAGKQSSKHSSLNPSIECVLEKNEEFAPKGRLSRILENQQ